MRGKGPEDVFFATNFPQTQAAGIDILKMANLSIGNHLLQFDDPW